MGEGGAGFLGQGVAMIQGRLTLAHRSSVLLIAALLCGGAVQAESYTRTELYHITAGISGGDIQDRWPTGTPQPVSGTGTLPGGSVIDYHLAVEVSVERGRITLTNEARGIDDTYYQRDLTLTEINLLVGPIDDMSGRYDPAAFPLSRLFIGPQALDLASRLTPDARPLLKPQRNDAEVDMLFPLDGALLQIGYDRVMVGDGEGVFSVHVGVLRPTGVAADFLPADVPEADALVFTEEEARAALQGDTELTFTEEDILQEIARADEDRLRILGCAAGLNTCPVGLDPDLVRIWIDTTEDPMDTLSDIIAERRAAGDDR